MAAYAIGNRAGPAAWAVRAGGWLALAVVAALTLGAVAVLAGRAETAPGLELRSGWWPDLGLAPFDWAALRFTLLQASLSAVFSALLAIPAARALARRRFPGRGLLVSLLGAPFLLPVIVAVMGLLAIWGRAGIVSETLTGLGFERLDIYGLHGVVLAHVFFNLPLATRLLLQGWLAIPAEQFRLAAQLGFRPRDVFLRLEWPMLRAVLPGAFLLVFLLCMTSFAVALTLGGGPRATTMELAIYQAIRFDFDLARAALLALLQFGLCAAVAFAALRLATPTGFGGGLLGVTPRWDADRAGLRVWDGAVLLLLILFLGAPMVAIVLRGLPALLAGLPPQVWPAAVRSLWVALASAAFALALGLALAAFVDALRTRGGRLFAEGLGVTVLAASPFVIGTALFIVIHPIADPFALALPVTATVNAAMSLPFMLRILTPALAQVRQDYARLADSLGLAGWAWFRLVVWPRLRRPAGFATGLAAALSMGDLGVIALFAPPDGATLPLTMQRLMGAYRMEAAAGTALLLAALTFGLFWIFDRGGRLNAAD